MTSWEQVVSRLIDEVPTGHVLTWNMGAERIKGYEAREIVGRHFSIFYPATDVATGKPDSELEIAARVGRYEDEGWRLRKDGSRFWDLTERRAAELRYRVLVERGE